MAKTDSYQTLESKITKQRKLVQKEQDKLTAMENEYYRALHDDVVARAATVNMTVTEYLDALS